MIEFSFTEMALLVWAVAATAGLYHYKERAFVTGMFLNKCIEDPKLYGEMRKQWLEAEKEVNA